VAKIEEIEDASIYDTSSRTRMPHLGEIAVWQNTAGYYLATKIEKLQARGYNSSRMKLHFPTLSKETKARHFAPIPQRLKDLNGPTRP
jgi:hypothetical protein